MSDNVQTDLDAFTRRLEPEIGRPLTPEERMSFIAGHACGSDALRAENERLRRGPKADDHGSWTHIKRDELNALRAENKRLQAEIETGGRIWNDVALLAARVEALNDGTADLGSTKRA